jgi:WD40 repeat protein
MNLRPVYLLCIVGLCLVCGAAAAEDKATSPDQKLEARADGKTIRVFDLATNKEVRSMSGHTDTVTSLVFSPDGKFLISGSKDRTVSCWEQATGKQIWRLALKAGVANVATSPDGKELIVTDEDKKTRTIDLATGKTIKE